MRISLTPSQKAVINSQANEILFASPRGGGKTTALIAATIANGENSIFGVHDQREISHIKQAAVDILEDSPGFSIHNRDNVMESIVTKTDGGVGSKKIKTFLTNMNSSSPEVFRTFMGREVGVLLIDEIYRTSDKKYKEAISGHIMWGHNYNAKVIATTSPENDAWFTKDDWVMKRWAAWFHPDPNRVAKMGELRYYVSYNDQEFEVGGPEEIEYLGLTLKPRSRTLIFAPLSENTWLNNENPYRDALSRMPHTKWEHFMYGTFN